MDLRKERMLLRRSKNAAAELTAIRFSAINCQGLQQHPFPRKDIVESLAEGTAGYRLKFN